LAKAAIGEWQNRLVETVVPEIITDPDPVNMQAPWELAPRRKGAKEGWEHKE
jgi:hypothetical protein